MDSYFKFPVWWLQQPCLLPLCLIQLCCLPFNIPIIFLFYKKTDLFLAALGLHGFVQTCSGWGFSLWGLLLLCSTGWRHGGFSSCDIWLSCCRAQALERCCGPGASLLHGTWDLSSTRDQTGVPGTARQILNPWTTRKPSPLAMLPGVWDPGFPDQDWTCPPCIGNSVRTTVPPEKSHLSFFFLIARDVVQDNCSK